MLLLERVRGRRRALMQQRDFSFGGVFRQYTVGLFLLYLRAFYGWKWYKSVKSDLTMPDLTYCRYTLPSF